MLLPEIDRHLKGPDAAIRSEHRKLVRKVASSGFQEAPHERGFSLAAAARKKNGALVPNHHS
jgi:hypothetical protein